MVQAWQSGALKMRIRTLQGRRVVVDGNLPERAGTTDGTLYTTYLLRYGAFAATPFQWEAGRQ